MIPTAMRFTYPPESSAGSSCALKCLQDSRAATRALGRARRLGTGGFPFDLQLPMFCLSRPDLVDVQTSTARICKARALAARSTTSFDLTVTKVETEGQRLTCSVGWQHFSPLQTCLTWIAAYIAATLSDRAWDIRKRCGLHCWFTLHQKVLRSTVRRLIFRSTKKSSFSGCYLKFKMISTC